MNQKEMDAIMHDIKPNYHEPTPDQHGDVDGWIYIKDLKEILSEYVEEGCVACQLSVIGDPRCSGMEHTCKEDK